MASATSTARAATWAAIALLVLAQPLATSAVRSLQAQKGSRVCVSNSTAVHGFEVHVDHALFGSCVPMQAQAAVGPTRQPAASSIAACSAACSWSAKGFAVQPRPPADPALHCCCIQTINAMHHAKGSKVFLKC